MRTSLDLTPLRRATIGFDRLFDMLESGAATPTGDSYPPFDLEQEGDERYRITIAVAGFRLEDLELTTQQNLLIVRGRKDEREDRRYLHRGIATRSFERRFVMGDYVRVSRADLHDGLLTIELVREIPQEMKPRRIAIGDGGSVRLSDQRASAKNDNQQERAAA
jgi:molecular chaperone IbpA